MPTAPKSYLQRFTHLRVARSRQHGEAPYKPALLLAVLDGIEDGSIQDNRIYITPELLAAFRRLCRDSSIWDGIYQNMNRPGRTTRPGRFRQ